MDNICINNLIVELGRKCNLNCDHCLRGQSQNIEVDIEKVKEILSTAQINSLTFSGGEPMLYKNKIIELIDFIISNNISILSFYMATNGTIFDGELMTKLSEFRGYVLSECNGYDIANMYEEDNFDFMVDISADEFHDGISPLNEAMFSAYSFVHFKKPFGNTSYLINEGNAMENGIGSRNMDHNEDFDFWDDDTYNEIGTVYLNSKGILLPDCDWSYDTQDHYKVQFETLEEIIEYYKETPAMAG